MQLTEGLVSAGEDFPVGPTSLGSVRKTNRFIVSQSDLWWKCTLVCHWDFRKKDTSLPTKNI